MQLKTCLKLRNGSKIINFIIENLIKIVLFLFKLQFILYEEFFQMKS